MKPLSAHHGLLLDVVAVASRPQIQELLEDILQSVPFRTSRQCQDLCRYIVEHSLAGSDESLRERVIGTEVFARASNYDTAEDPVVRIRAADIRKRLAQYFQAHQNTPGSWKIEIPTGSYKAQFHCSDDLPAQIATSAAIPHPLAEPLPALPHPPILEVEAAKPKWQWALVGLTAVVLVLLASLLSVRMASSSRSAFDLFWQPILEGSKPVVVCTGSNPVYILPLEILTEYKKAHPHSQGVTPNLQMLVPREELKNFRAEDFSPAKDTFLTIGDASATAQIAALLSTQHRAYDLRYGSDLSFGDLRQDSAVLIGAFNNSWTLNMTDNLRFVFDSGDTPEMHVQDRSDKSRSWWPRVVDGSVREDYAIVSRILNSKTGSVLVTIAGLNHSGTRAAAEFATNPQLISEFVNHAPKDWNRKNLQIVLHTNVVNDVPGSPTVVTAYYW